jgi:hypothetical protein
VKETATGRTGSLRIVEWNRETRVVSYAWLTPSP